MALRSHQIDTVVVSTEDEEIAAVAREYGAQVPFLRPAELARDETSGTDPVLHALEQLPGFDAVLLLQPTSPLRTTADIDACLDLARERQANAVVSVSEPESHPCWMYRLSADQRLQSVIDGPLIPSRESLPTVYALNGALYYARADWMRQHGTFITAETVAYVMPAERSVDIDTPLDWKLAELLLIEQA